VPGEGRTSSNIKTARIVGALFIIATVAGMLSALVILQPILAAPDYLVRFAEDNNKVITGALLDLVGAGAFVGIAVVIFPILKKHNERMALGYVVARSFEAVPFIVANTFLLSLLAVGQEYVQAGAPDASHFQTQGSSLLAAYDWSQLLGPRILASLAGLLLYYSFYQSRLLPRWISVWGLVGAPLYLASGLLPMFGFDPLSPILTLLFLPAALLEMVLAVWLIVKGFNSSAITSRAAEQT
jgi:succinate dehydrogenase hydrophobic anchor subunit